MSACSYFLPSLYNISNHAVYNMRRLVMFKMSLLTSPGFHPSCVISMAGIGIVGIPIHRTAGLRRGHKLRTGRRFCAMLRRVIFTIHCSWVRVRLGLVLHPEELTYAAIRTCWINPYQMWFVSLAWVNSHVCPPIFAHGILYTCVMMQTSFILLSIVHACLFNYCRSMLLIYINTKAWIIFQKVLDYLWQVKQNRYAMHIAALGQLL